MTPSDLICDSWEEFNGRILFSFRVTSLIFVQNAISLFFPFKTKSLPFSRHFLVKKTLIAFYFFKATVQELLFFLKTSILK